MSEDLHMPEEDEMTLEGLLRYAMAHKFFDVHTSFSARVVAFDREDHTVDLEVGYHRYRPVRRRPDGIKRWSEERFPILPAVPVVYPYGGQSSITFPVEIGDWMLVIAQEHATQHMREINEPCDPEYRARHTLNGLVAIPGVLTSGKRAGEVIPDYMRIGSKDSSDAHVTIGVDDVRLGGHDATAFVALAQEVVSALNKINEAVRTWTPVANDGGAAFRAKLIEQGIGSGPSFPGASSIAATKVKAK